MEQYRIENIQEVRLNGKNCIMFKAYEFDSKSNAYMFCGQFTAPTKTPKNKLKDYIE
jgi:hypothetical protein